MNKIRIIHSVFCQIGLNILKIKNIRFVFRYIQNYLKFSAKSKIDYIFPVLGEHVNASGRITKHYFYQDLLVASYIFKQNPKKHVDIGSRIDGFIAQVASFRKIEVFDIRKNKINFKNIIFKKKDINKLGKNLINYCDSLSCLHTIEHFGLGRYGDKIDPKGHIKGFVNILKLLKTNGIFYVSFPISNHNRVCFDSERLFHPKEILKWSKNLDLIKFDFIDDQENIFLDVNLNKFKKKVDYGCGIYQFRKK